MQLVLVTGISGYLGAHCAKALLDHGYKVRGTVRSLRNEKKVAPIRALNPTGDRLELVEADLNNSTGWQAAINGCEYVLHVASPFPLGGTQETIDTALNGTAHVLEACANSSSVRKVVLTSSVAAVCEGLGRVTKPLNEAVWSNLENVEAPYIKSKTLAEKFAWDFVARNRKHQFKLTTILPGFVIGAPLTSDTGASIAVVSEFFSAPVLPKITFVCVDVHDAAQAHVNALARPDSDGLRILATESKCRYMIELSRAIHRELRPLGYSVVTRTIPDWLTRLIAMFDAKLRPLLCRLSDETEFDNSRLRNVLGIQPTDTRLSAVEMAHGLIQKGFVPRREPK